jgi:hypothetical protein
MKPFALIAALVLTGCAAPTVAPLAAPQLPPHAKPVDRHLLETVDVGATKLWGLRYTSTTENYKRTSMNDCWGSTYGAHYINGEGCVLTLGWDVNWSKAGSGEFETIGRRPSPVWDERFIFTVPDDQVLVINELSGSYTCINGFQVGSAIREKVNYLFGGGEVVIFNLAAGSWLAGFTADPSLLGGAAKGTKQVK